MSNTFDVMLHDDVLMTEVELTADLMVAATSTDDRLPVAEIDRILGVVPFAG
ncbi:hypothetical protein [Nocardioides sambongensis]|uniref:hypothetical protein n=1 Tax=Nocardioides sambongensis TaxID=2589074 RepID=UPI0015E84AF7|nr:hypothetical protein [Nocardioides sambongensis]